MQSADEPTDEGPHAASRSPISIAILAAVACVPIVVAAGFLTDRSAGSAANAPVPGDISVLSLRGDLDAPAGRRPDVPQRAGY